MDLGLKRRENNVEFNTVFRKEGNSCNVGGKFSKC